MKLKIFYRKNLKMSKGKIAAQACHAAIGISAEPGYPVIVLGASDVTFSKLKAQENCFVVQDAGYTEVKPGTETCLAYFDT